jgi:hypothetical protein
MANAIQPYEEALKSAAGESHQHRVSEDLGPAWAITVLVDPRGYVKPDTLDGYPPSQTRHMPRDQHPSMLQVFSLRWTRTSSSAA